MFGSKTDPKAVVARARQLLDEKRYADALQACTDELARGADDPELRLVAALSLAAQGRHEGAKKEALQVIRMDPHQSEAHRILADVAFSRGELTSAQDHLEKVLQIDPSDEKSRAMLESLSRPSLVDNGSKGPDTMPIPKSMQLRAMAVGLGEPREESGSMLLEEEDLEEDNSFMASLDELDQSSGTSATVKGRLQDNDLAAGWSSGLVGAPKHAVHASRGPASGLFADGDDLADGGDEEERDQGSSGAFQISDSMLEELPAAPDSDLLQVEAKDSPPPRGLMTEHDPHQDELSSDDNDGWGEPPTRSITADDWKPSSTMDTGAGQSKKFPGTLRLPALADFPEDDEAPTMPLLRASGPPQPQLRLDPLGAKPVSHHFPPEQKVAPSPSPDALDSDELEEVSIEQASIPSVSATPVSHGAYNDPAEPRTRPLSLPATSRPGPPLASTPPSRALSSTLPKNLETSSPAAPSLSSLRGKKASAEFFPAAPTPAPSPSPAKSEEGTIDLLGLLTGQETQEPEAAPTHALPKKKPSDSFPALDLPSPPIRRPRSTPKPSFAPEDSMERQLIAAASVPGVRSKPRLTFRWIMVAVVGLALGAGGFGGYLWYRSYKYVQSEWKNVRESLHQSTPEGYRQAMEAAQRILDHRKRDANAESALGMCDAAMSIEFGEDRLKPAQEHLNRSKGTDSEWRTAAIAFLALMDEPARAEGYLLKGLEVYPESALLYYLRGRAEAASGTPEKASESYKRALRQEPRYVAARIAQAILQGQQPSGYNEALSALDEILRVDPDNIQALIERARLRATHSKEPETAAADAKRVTSELAEKAGRGQVGWAHLVLAQVAALANQTAIVSTELDEAIKSPPCCDSTFRYELAGELMKLYRYADARTQMKEALTLKPKQAEFLLRMARVLLDLDDAKQAGDYLKVAPARHPETRYLMGRLTYAEGNYKKALRLMNDVKKELPDPLEPAVYIGYSKAQLGKFDEAISSLQKLVSEHPQNPGLSKALGIIQLWAGQYNPADTSLKAAWKVTRLDPSIPTQLGYVSLGVYEIPKARKRFDRALRIIPTYREAIIGLIQLSLTIGQPTEARKWLGQISKEDRKKADVYAITALVNIAEGKLEGARAAIAQAQRAGTPAAMVARLSGELALARKEGAEAQEQLSKAAKLALRKDADLLVKLGKAQLLQRKVDEAYDTFHLALKEDPGHPVALLELGRIAIYDGEHPLALKRFNDALARVKERSLPNSLAAAAHSALGQAYLNKGDTGRSITNLQDAIDLDPEAAEPQLLMGKTYDKLDRPQRAINYYNRALELDSTLTEVYELLGRAYAKSGDSKSAIKYYEDYLRTQPSGDRARVVQSELKRLQQGM